MLVPCNGILDRLATRLHQAAHGEPAPATLDIHVEFDRGGHDVATIQGFANGWDKNC